MKKNALTVITLALLTSVFLPTAAASKPQAHGEHHAAEHPPLNVTEFFHRDKDAYGGTLEPGEQPMNPGLAFVLINFGLFVAGLFMIFRKVVNPAVAKRHETIQNDLNEAASLRKQAEAELAEHRKKLESADKDIAKMVEDIRSAAEEEKTRLLSQAKAQADAMKKDTEARIEAELAQAKRGLERDLVGAAIEKAKKRLADGTNSGDQDTLVSAFVTNLGQKGARP